MGTDKELGKRLIEIVNRETQIAIEMMKINERFETAKNLNDRNELEAIDEDGKKVEFRLKHHICEKVMFMTMFISRNKNFQFN